MNRIYWWNFTYKANMSLPHRGRLGEGGVMKDLIRFGGAKLVLQWGYALSPVSPEGEKPGLTGVYRQAVLEAMKHQKHLGEKHGLTGGIYERVANYNKAGRTRAVTHTP